MGKGGVKVMDGELAVIVVCWAGDVICGEVAVLFGCWGGDVFMGLSCGDVAGEIGFCMGRGSLVIGCVAAGMFVGLAVVIVLSWLSWVGSRVWVEIVSST
ncbi:hypothetical protein OIU74_023056 [Salix koriyanagi]|uniref:Transmembrane protein n=1 Tax=Salix koriyanagi TaxID=2511006 RepID=A0A9Q0WB95_9ROSI|nr:hypothetical protein OIU74_023056 [Salix koriyanagi]